MYSCGMESCNVRPALEAAVSISYLRTFYIKKITKIKIIMNKQLIKTMKKGFKTGIGGIKLMMTVKVV